MNSVFIVINKALPVICLIPIHLSVSLMCMFDHMCVWTTQSVPMSQKFSMRSLVQMLMKVFVASVPPPSCCVHGFPLTWCSPAECIFVFVTLIWSFAVHFHSRNSVINSLNNQGMHTLHLHRILQSCTSSIVQTEVKKTELIYSVWKVFVVFTVFVCPPSPALLASVLASSSVRTDGPPVPNWHCWCYFHCDLKHICYF